MLSEAHVNEVIAKCEVLKAAGLWAREPKLRPRAWIQNFSPVDRPTAAFLLDKFTFYNADLTSKLLIASYNSLGDGMAKSVNPKSQQEILSGLSSAILTPVKGESPNPTDSGYLVCRMARQSLHIDDSYVLDTDNALQHAYHGGTVIFVDDFVGSGDQFLTTWKLTNPANLSFQDAYSKSGFLAIYVTLVVTDFGLGNIRRTAPNVSICATHILSEKSTIRGILSENPGMAPAVESLLERYSTRLTPSEQYMSPPEYLKYGYKKRGLLLGFDHSVPDATLPIFWSQGTNNWEPLIERS
ncbi:hypothetical protein KUC85_15505 [Pseudomonas aeruginosa]|uniref:phosphoribosyltransferase-like protein n=1 Tax=Pseudomonas aeruginosa TaxID=287 RepID=UPI000F54AB92|nr:hypothetical protein [Pseudomonas aeruginosa]MBX5648227.1 hypothetical protein [Pseudomonas aeruginosa]MCV0030021.1 hypothetical protein [Pseudomonas aeruginosa]MCY0414812.1 hypothetical protein [Pseudomonas aeruginosa]MCY0430641.1 hypothetical protein [Pseudomonas aeruginosa]MDH7539493.1 hypothetical protein [Pseudomonas aeruginosa]